MLGGDSGDIRDYLDFNLTRDIGLVFLMIGANDGRNRIAVDKVRAHLIEIIERVRARGVPIVLAAMGVRADDDRMYAAEFDAIYPELARRYKIPMMPFPLRGIVGHADLTVDGAHPNEKGHRIIADRVYAFLDPSRLP
jgi:acyl-CoA thioesterase I